jgi:hypothetical protein
MGVAETGIVGVAMIGGMFTAWLLDQQGREDSIGDLADLVYEDHNAGCAIMFKDAVAWLSHFESSHRKQLVILTEMLGDAYVEYCTQLGTHTNEF